MHFVKKPLVLASAAALASLLTACGSGTTTAPASLRVVNLVPATSTNATADTVSLTMAMNTTSTAVNYSLTAAPGVASTYTQVDPGSFGGTLAVGNDPAIASTAFPLGVATNQIYTILAYPRTTNTGGTQLYPFQLIDNMPIPASGQFNLSVANASPDAGAVDIYVLERTTSTTPASACAENLTAPAFSSVQPSTYAQSAYLPYNINTTSGTAITYDICVTAAGNPLDTRLSVLNLAPSSGVSYVFAVTSAAGGVLANAALVPQTSPATITSYTNNQFRVRVLSALSGADAQNAALTTLTFGTGASATTVTVPALGAGNYSGYTTIVPPSGVTSAAVAVTGATTVASIAKTLSFSPGADYTILVYDNAGTATATILTDDNHTDATKARVRLVNAIDPATNGVSAYFGGQVGPSDIALGNDLAVGQTGSPYTPMTPSTANDIVTLSSTDLTNPAAQSVTGLFAGGGVYTVFMYSMSQPARVIQDR
jgi:hypothetical protein